jgi:predicted Zn-dependent protease
MRPLHYFIAGFLVIVGFGLSLMLIPRESELALIYFRDKEFDSARQVYEKRLAEGDFSAAVVMPLTQLYLHYGEVGPAINLMERYVAKNPNDTQAQLRLGKFYQYGQQPYDYQLNLEKIVRTAPTEPALRELADIYNFTAQFDKQIAVLQKLIELHLQRHADFLDLANLQASQGRFADAATTLINFEATHPDHVNTDTVQLLLSLLLDSGQADSAASRAREWLRRHPSLETAARLAEILHFKGQPTQALALLQPFEKDADRSPILLAELVQLQIQLGQADRALERLSLLFNEKRLPDLVLEPFIDLLLAKPDVTFAIEVAKNINLSLLPDRLLANLAEAALAAGRGDFATEMVKAVGEGFLETHPILGASLAFARSDNGAAQRWIAKAAAADLPVRDRVALSSLYVRAARIPDAIRLLEQLAGLAETPDSAFVDLARLYLESGRASEGLRLFENARRVRRAVEVQSSWALIAAASGQYQEVAEWLNVADASATPTQILTDLYFLGEDNSAHGLAAAAAERLHKRQPNRTNRLRLASALTDVGRPSEALHHLREIMRAQDVSAGEDNAYLAALSAARAEGEHVDDELRAYWSHKLATAGLTQTRREELLYALLDVNAYDIVLPSLAALAREQGGKWLFAYTDAALKANRKSELVAFLKSELVRTDLALSAKEPHMFALLEHGGETAALPFLRQFAEGLGGNWIFGYEGAARKTGRSAELLDFWKHRLMRTDVPRDERIDTAIHILEAGQKKEAEQALIELAKNASPASREVSQLLFIWGPRPPEYPLDWIEARARSAPPEDQRLWIEHLLNLAAPRRAAAVAAMTRHLDLYLRSLVAAADGAALTDIVTRELGSQENPETLRLWARLALETNETNTAGLVFAKLVLKLPDDPESLRWLGALTFARGHYLDSKKHLSHLFEISDGDYETHFYYGEALLRDGERLKAGDHYNRALQMIDRSPQKPLAMRAVRAQVLDRLGRTGESITAFEALIRERPADKHLRADFATVLLRSANYRDAERVLSDQ